jgi:hypothetical protein
MIFSEKVRPVHLLRKNHPLNQQYLNSYSGWRTETVVWGAALSTQPYLQRFSSA